MNPFDDEITTPYLWDIPLIKELNLQMYACKHGEETFFGKVENDEYCIECFVSMGTSCVPAKFYKFIILNKDSDKKIILKTGSGSFSDYWKTAELFGKNLLIVQKVDK